VFLVGQKISLLSGRARGKAFGNKPGGCKFFAAARFIAFFERCALTLQAHAGLDRSETKSPRKRR